ncbi:mitochondrial protein from FMP27-domain-containing protein [Podospora fimiseda]|uniref:COP9 signalosome complex subunit 5 n=1 Tax=Podospora fimiseda TaxID=252190 RepID=A0AAN7BKA9_9PEZI|nr:mitochondrial protein from FMP27-domain-containing protein [Podospora fimiseda]
MALLNPTFVFGIIVLLYLSSFVLFAVIRITTGLSIQRLGYFSLRRLSYTPRDGIRIDIRGLGLNVHRPTFAQPTWLSIVVSELAVTVNIGELEGTKAPGATPNDSDESDNENEGSQDKATTTKGPTLLPPPADLPRIVRRETNSEGRSKTWKQLTKLKENIKLLHRKVNWLRMVDIVATNSTVSIEDVGNVQLGSVTVAVDTRRKMVDQARFFMQGAAERKGQKQQAEWIVTLRSVLFTAAGGEAQEVLDSASLNIHGYLYEALDGLRDAAIALKLGRVHIPYDEVRRSATNYKQVKKQVRQGFAESRSMEKLVDQVIQEIDLPGSTANRDLMQTVSDSKELVSSVLRGIKEVQFAVSHMGFTKRIDAVRPAGSPILLSASMKEVGIDLHRLDSKSPAHRMYFPSKDIAHEALAAALSISIGLDDGHGKPERIMYIPMATTTMRTTLPSKTVELANEGTAEQRNANILFANSVVTSPSVDLDPRHLPLLLAILQRKPKMKKHEPEQKHMLISRLLPKANIKFSMHEPVVRIALPPVHKGADPDDFDLIISSISSISLDMESFHSTVEELHYSLAATMRLQNHRLYYQTCAGNEKIDLLETDSFDLKVQLNASPTVQVVATGNLQNFALKMVRDEIGDGLRQIVRQLRLDVEPDKRAVSKTPKHSNFLRGMPAWLLHFQLQCSDFSFEVAGVDKDIAEESRGLALQLDTWSVEYRAQRLDGLQRRPSRRRASSRSMMSPEADILKAIPMSPRKKYHHDGDGRRVAFHFKGLEAYMIEAEDKWEVEPFVSVPRVELAFSTLSDNQGPVFHIQSQIRTVRVQYSLYRHYAVGVAITVLRKAFVGTNKDFASPVVSGTPKFDAQRLVVGHLSPPTTNGMSDFMLGGDDSLRVVRELIAVDIKATMIQIKAELPSDPPMMLQIFNVEAGRHRWSPPFLHAKLVRLYAEAPRMRRVWARIISIKNVRLDYRESRRKLTGAGVHDERMFDIVSETIRVAVPHDLVVYKITDNFVNVIKSAQQLHHRFKTGTNEYILDKGPEGPKNVPKVSIRAKTLLFELEDGAFEWKLGVIYRAGLVEMMQREAREEAFRVKVKKIHEEDSKRGSAKQRARSAAPRGVPNSSGGSQGHERRKRSSSETRYRGRAPRYDPEAGSQTISGTTRISIAEAREKLNVHNAKSWKQRIDQQYEVSRNSAKDMHSLFWGVNDVPEDMDDSEKILEIPQRPSLAAALVNDLHITIDEPSFPIKELPDFLHKVGKGMPRDMKYSLLVPMSVRIDMGEAKITLRDYPLPFIHVPSTKSGQSARLPALSLTTDFVVAEEYRGPQSMRKITVQVVPAGRSLSLDPSAPNSGSFAVDVRRTIGPVKTFSDMSVDIHTANPTRITWGPSYQPAIQDMMMAIESMTKPQLDPSEKVGFWDKIRLNFHSRVRVAWRGDGDVHLALKGSRDPYQVTGTGAGFIMCWRNDVRWNIHTDDDPKRFMTVDSNEFVLAVPDYSHQVRETRRQHGEDESITSSSSYQSGAAFKKVVMKLSGKVQVLAGLVFERAIENGKRSFDFKPHYDVVLKAPRDAKPENGKPYDAFRGFRSQHIHLSVAVRAPVDREWTGMVTEPSRSYNTVHLTPRFFTHFFAWWSLFSGPLSLPVRQGALWPGREKNSKKFGRHLATIKYNILLAPLFLSHIYKHKDVEDYSENSVSATGIKVRIDSWMLDLHQRREEFNTRDRGRGTQTRTTGMKLHAGQLDLVSADIRAVSASIRGTTADAVLRHSLSTFITDQEGDGTDLSRFTIPDNDLTWIDMDDFVELDWILPTEPNPDTKILPLAFAPRITYFRQTDIGGTIDGDPDRTSDFGQEPTHFCIMSQDDDPRRVQSQLIRRRLAQIDVQMETHERNLGELELRLVRGDITDADLGAEFDILTRHSAVLAGRKNFLEGMLREMMPHCPSTFGDGESTCTERDSSIPFDLPPDDDDLTSPESTEFASDFKNRFVVHNMQLKWNNTLRNIILRYIHQVGQRRGFVYYLSRPAVKFILDLVDEQTKSKTAKQTAPSTRTGSTPDTQTADRDIQKDIEDRIRKILQDGKKFSGTDDGEAAGGHPTMADLSSGIADEFTTQNSYHVRLIAPQIQLQSDKNKKHVVLTTAKGMELKVVDVLEKSRMSDEVSGLVQQRFLVNMDSTQFFVTHQKWFSTQLVSMYSGNTYGTPSGSSWPPWVPMEVMFDFQADPFGFKRVVQKTSALLRYDKYNNLRLKYNDEVNTSENESINLQDGAAESRTDNLWVEFPQAHALCNSSQYYAIYVIVLDLLMYSEPLEKTRNERLEKIMLASDFSDLRGAPEMVTKLQERVRQLEDIKTHFQTHSKQLDKQGWKDRLLLERDLAACEDELFFMMKAITTSQRKFDGTTSSALLKWSIAAKEIVWQLIRDNNEPLVELQLKDVEYDRTDNSDGSHINLIQVGKVLGLNLLPDAIYPVMVAPYVEGNAAGTDDDSKPMIRVYWNMLEAIAGIPIMDHFEVNLFPLKVQLEREVGKKLFEYIFPGIDGDGAPTDGKNTSPFMIKQTLPGEEDEKSDNESMNESVPRLGAAISFVDNKDNASDIGQSQFETRAGSLELRLRPTLTSDPDEDTAKHKALSIHSGEGNSFRLFRSGTGFKAVGKKASHDSLRNATNPRPGIGRTGTGFSAVSVSGESRKASRFGLRHRSSGNGDKPKQSDDLTKMIDRASNYMTFSYIKMPSVVLCVSYKGKGERNFEDVHDFVFRLPTIEYHNKTWSNLDLALALKSRVIKALISHTGAIIGNKFKHRPNIAQQNKLRELANNSALLATPYSYAPSIAESRDNSGDDSSSLYGVSPVDFSRSPPQSIRRAQTSAPTPAPASSNSRSPSIASSRSQRSATTHVASGSGGSGVGAMGGNVSVSSQASGAIPTFLMTQPTISTIDSMDMQGGRSGFNLLRPSSSGWSRPFGGQSTPVNTAGVKRPGSSSGVSLAGMATSSTFTSITSNGHAPETSPERKRAGTTGHGIREKFHAFANRLKDREATVVHVGGGEGGGGVVEESEAKEDNDERGGGSGLFKTLKLPPLNESIVHAQRDSLYSYDKLSQDNTGNPWLKDPIYFKTVRISSVALLKMTMHARSGGNIEIMGMMQGYIDNQAIVITDAFRLPVEGTETRVMAANEADEYLVTYLQGCRDESRQENVVGWYHSHPGYGCWLSGIDVETQKLQQMQGPMVAIVVDPDRTISTGKVEIGAFRTYPEDYVSNGGMGGVDVPVNKGDDFGAHANKYYALEVEHYKSTLDEKLLGILWEKYWVQTVGQNLLFANRDFSGMQMRDLGQRVKNAAAAITMAGSGGGGGGGGGRQGGGGGNAGYDDSWGSSGEFADPVPHSNSSAQIRGNGGGGGVLGKGASQESFDRILRDMSQVAAKEKLGLTASEVKQVIFGGQRPNCGGCRPPVLLQRPQQQEVPEEAMDEESA